MGFFEVTFRVNLWRRHGSGSVLQATPSGISFERRADAHAQPFWFVAMRFDDISSAHGPPCSKACLTPLCLLPLKAGVHAVYDACLPRRGSVMFVQPQFDPVLRLEVSAPLSIRSTLVRTGSTVAFGLFCTAR
jgi:hypothetical protein